MLRSTVVRTSVTFPVPGCPALEMPPPEPVVLIAGDDAVLQHEVRVADPDAASSTAIGAAVADGKSLEGGGERVGRGAMHVKDAIELPAVDDRFTGAGALDESAVLDVQVADRVGIVGSFPAQPEHAGRDDDGIGAGVRVCRGDRFAERHLAVAGDRVERHRDGEC